MFVPSHVSAWFSALTTPAGTPGAITTAPDTAFPAVPYFLADARTYGKAGITNWP